MSSVYGVPQCIFRSAHLSRLSSPLVPGLRRGTNVGWCLSIREAERAVGAPRQAVEAEDALREGFIESRVLASCVARRVVQLALVELEQITLQFPSIRESLPGNRMLALPDRQQAGRGDNGIFDFRRVRSDQQPIDFPNLFPVIGEYRGPDDRVGRDQLPALCLLAYGSLRFRSRSCSAPAMIGFLTPRLC